MSLISDNQNQHWVKIICKKGDGLRICAFLTYEDSAASNPCIIWQQKLEKSCCNFANFKSVQNQTGINLNEPCHEKMCFLHM